MTAAQQRAKAVEPRDPSRPLPRWTQLPGDPPQLRKWLAARSVQAGEPLPEDWPQEPSP